MSLEQQQVQKQLLRVEMRHSLEILQKPIWELREYLQEKALSNPLLELEHVSDDALHELQQAENELQREEAEDWKHGDSESCAAWEAAPVRFRADGADGDFDMTALLADPHSRRDSLADALREQLLHLPHLTEALRGLCDYLIDCLNENGLLEFRIEELAQTLCVPVFDLQQALYVLQGLSPAGVGARSLSECLVLQLACTRQFNAHTLQLVQHGLELLAQNNLAAIAKLLHCSKAQAQEAAAAVRALNPRPAQGYRGQRQTVYPVPEATVYAEQGEVRVRMNGALLPSLSINHELCGLLEQGPGPQEQAYLKRHLAEARQTLQFVTQRQTTLERLLTQLAQLQEGFFLRGEPLQPLSLTQVAQQLSVSPSTVSRAVRDKYIGFSGKCIALRSLFPGAVTGQEGQVVSDVQIKQQIQRFVQAENPARPLSDEALRDALLAVQLGASRRTVAKYREELGIPASSRRKRM